MTVSGDADALVDEIRTLCVRLSEMLWAVHRADGVGSRLLFPRTRDDGVRISEQESRVLLCQLLERSRFFYSIETPTTETYQQTGSTPVSGRSDLSFYETHEHESKLANVELKAGNPDAEDFRKDFEKVLREDLPGLWFHTLENTNRGTFPSLFQKIRDAFSLLQSEIGGRSHSIVFAFCVLSRRETWINTVTLSASVIDQLTRIHSVFDAAHLQEPASGGWTIHRVAPIGVTPPA